MNLNKTINALNRNRLNAQLVTVETLFPVLESLLIDSKTVGYGGSVTLDELGVKEWLRSQNKYELLDRDILPDPTEAINQSMLADTYLMSSNAVTEDGFLYNVDGRGNRCAALTYGPKQVILICGSNKIVPDLAAAVERVETVAAPKNAKRLHLNTPCVTTGHCMHCLHKQRICCSYVCTGFQRDPNRIHILLLDQPLGY